MNWRDTWKRRPEYTSRKKSKLENNKAVADQYVAEQRISYAETVEIEGGPELLEYLIWMVTTAMLSICLHIIQAYNSQLPGEVLQAQRCG